MEEVEIIMVILSSVLAGILLMKGAISWSVAESVLYVVFALCFMLLNYFHLKARCGKR